MNNNVQNIGKVAGDEATTKVATIMTEVWDQHPVEENRQEWFEHASWLVKNIRDGASKASLDEHLSRAQAHLKISPSMAFRKIVDRAVEVTQGVKQPTAAAQPTESQRRIDPA